MTNGASKQREEEGVVSSTVKDKEQDATEGSVTESKRLFASLGLTLSSEDEDNAEETGDETDEQKEEDQPKQPKVLFSPYCLVVYE